MFINGLPIGVIELKNLVSEQTDIWSAFNQLQTYKEEISDLFVFNEALVISDGLNARVGSLTSTASAFCHGGRLRSGRPAVAGIRAGESGARFFAPDLFSITCDILFCSKTATRGS